MIHTHPCGDGTSVHDVEALAEVREAEIGLYEPRVSTAQQNVKRTTAATHIINFEAADASEKLLNATVEQRAFLPTYRQLGGIGLAREKKFSSEHYVTAGMMIRTPEAWAGPSRYLRPHSEGTALPLQLPFTRKSVVSGSRGSKCAMFVACRHTASTYQVPVPVPISHMEGV